MMKETETLYQIIKKGNRLISKMQSPRLSKEHKKRIEKQLQQKWVVLKDE